MRALSWGGSWLGLCPDLSHPITAAIASVGFCFGQLHPTQPQNQGPEVESVRVLLTCISFGVTKVIQ